MKKPLLLITTAVGVFLLPSFASAQAPQSGNPLELHMPADAVVPESAKPDWMKYQDSYTGEQNNLANPNRTNEEILAWVQEVATEALTFEPSNVDTKLRNQKAAFVPQGWQQYSQYLADTKLADLVRTQNYAVTTIVDGDPSVVNAAAAGGNYHWLVEAPLLMTFTKFDPVTGNSKPAGGGKFKLTMQLGRMSERPDAAGTAAGKEGLGVESWKIQKVN